MALIARPEHAVLLAATRVAGTATPALEDALSARVDWTRVVELALAHRLAPALLAALETADPALVPPDILDALRLHCQRLRTQSDALVSELFELLDALEARAVTVIPFKGPLLSELLFDDAGMRSPGDIDLLVRQADVALVREVLEERGYVDGDQRPGEPALTDPSWGCPVWRDRASALRAGCSGRSGSGAGGGCRARRR